MDTERDKRYKSFCNEIKNVIEVNLVKHSNDLKWKKANEIERISGQRVILSIVICLQSFGQKSFYL
jgi:hypothetical protein